MPQIFVNFRTGDETFAALLIDQKLAEKFGPDNVFRDSRSIPLGEEFTSLLWGQLADSQILLAVIGKRWLTLETDGVRRLDMPGDYVRREIAFALRSGVRVVPVLIEDTPMPKAHQLPEEIAELARRQYIRLYPRDAHRVLPALAEELSALLAGGNTSSRPLNAAATAQVAVAAEQHYTVVVAKIEGFATLTDPARITSRQLMYESLRHAAEAAGIAWDGVGRVDRVDGVFLLVPPPTSSAQVAGDMVDKLRTQAGDRVEADGMRLRIGIHHGLATRDPSGWVSTAMMLAGQLADAQALTEVFGRAVRAQLIVVVSDDFYRNVVQTGLRSIYPSTYACLAASDLPGPAWVFVPGYPSPPGLPHPASPPSPKGSRAKKKPGQTVFQGPVVGQVHLGEGDQHQHISSDLR